MKLSPHPQVATEGNFKRLMCHVDRGQKHNGRPSMRYIRLKNFYGREEMLDFFPPKFMVLKMDSHSFRNGWLMNVRNQIYFCFPKYAMYSDK